jgi:hypothetical protein
MTEVSIEEFEDFYKEKLDDLFAKLKRAVGKLISDVKGGLVEIKKCTDHFLEAAEEKVDEKSQRSLHFFSDKIKKEIDGIELPEDEITYDNTLELLASIKRLFNNINEIARKSLPKFKSEVQTEIKELNYFTRKLGKKQTALEQFMRKKYTELKEAEYLLNKLPKLFTLRDNIESSKRDLDEFERELAERKKREKELNERLVKLEKNDLFRKLEEERENLFKLRIDVNDKLGFKKALKKMKFNLEKGDMHISNVDLNYLRDFLKDSIRTLAKESSDLIKFSSLLVQLRHTLEENKLNLKTETKEKTIEQINAIFENKQIYDEIENIRKINANIVQIESEIKEAGLAAQLEDLKNEISANAVKLEHLESDLDRKNKDYMRHLSTLKEEREEFQSLISDVLNEQVKLTISFSF